MTVPKLEEFYQLPYKRRFRVAAEWARQADPSEVQLAAQNLLKQNSNEDVKLSYSSKPSVSPDTLEDDWEVVLSGQKTNTSKTYTDRQIGLTLAFVIQDVDLLLKELNSPSELLKPLTIEYLIKLVDSELLYELLTGKKLKLSPATIHKLLLASVKERRIDVLDRLALDKWHNTETNQWIHGCSPKIVHEYLHTHLSTFPEPIPLAAKKLNYKRLSTFHAHTLIDLLERDLSTTGPALPTNVSYTNSPPLESWSQATTKQEEDRPYRLRLEIWEKWNRFSFTQYSSEILRTEGTVERILDLIEKWPLANWNDGTGVEKHLIFKYPTVFPIYALLQQDFERTLQVILRAYFAMPLIANIPTFSSFIKGLDFARSMRIAREVHTLLVRLHKPDFTSSQKNIWFISTIRWLKDVLSAFQQNDRKEWLLCLSWVHETIVKHVIDKNGAISQVIGLFMDSSRSIKPVKQKQFARQHKIAKGIRDSLVQNTNIRPKSNPRQEEVERKQFTRQHKIAKDICDSLIPLICDSIKQRCDSDSTVASLDLWDITLDNLLFFQYLGQNFIDLGIYVHAAFLEILLYARKTKKLKDIQKFTSFIDFGSCFVDMLIDSIENHRAMQLAKQEDVDNAVLKYIEIFKMEDLDPVKDQCLACLQKMAFICSEETRRKILNIFSVDQLQVMASSSLEELSRLLCWTLPPAERELLVKKILEGEELTESVIEKLNSLGDLKNPETKSSLAKFSGLSSIVSRLNQWNTFLTAVLLNQDVTVLMSALKLLSTRIANEPIMNRENILSKIMPSAESSLTINKNSLPYIPTLLQFYNTYGNENTDWQQHESLWFNIFTSITNASDLPPLTRTTIPTIIHMFKVFGVMLLSRYARETHPFFQLGFEILWRIHELQYGVSKAGEIALFGPNTKLNIVLTSNASLISPEYGTFMKRPLFGCTFLTEKENSDVALHFVEKIVRLYERKLQNFEEGNKNWSVQLSPLLAIVGETWPKVPVLEQLVRSWIRVLMKAPSDKEGLLNWRPEGKDTNSRDIRETADRLVDLVLESVSMACIEGNTNNNEHASLQLSTVIVEAIDLIMKSNRADMFVSTWIQVKSWGRMEDLQLKDDLVTQLLKISRSAIHLDYVTEHVMSNRHDILDEYIGNNSVVTGIFYSASAARKNLSLPPRSPNPNLRGSRYKRTGRTKALTIAPQIINLNHALAEDEEEEIPFLFPPFKGYIHLHLTPPQNIRLGEQLLEIAQDRNSSGEERLASINRFTYLPTTDYNTIIRILDEDGTEPKKLTDNLVDALINGLNRVDEPMSPLEYLLSPKILESNARMGILGIRRVITYLQPGMFSNILASTLQGQRRKALKVVSHKQIVRMIGETAERNPTDAKIILQEFKRVDLHRDVQIEILKAVFHWLNVDSEENGTLREIGWHILETAFMKETLSPEMAFFLLSALPSSGFKPTWPGLTGVAKCSDPPKELGDLYNYLTENQSPQVRAEDTDRYFTLIIGLVRRFASSEAESENLYFLSIIALQKWLCLTPHFHSALVETCSDSKFLLTRNLDVRGWPTTFSDKNAEVVKISDDIVKEALQLIRSYLERILSVNTLEINPKEEIISRNRTGVMAIIELAFPLLASDLVGKDAESALEYSIEFMAERFLAQTVKNELHDIYLNYRDLISFYLNDMPVCLRRFLGSDLENRLLAGVIKANTSSGAFEVLLLQRALNQFDYQTQSPSEASQLVFHVLQRAVETENVHKIKTGCILFIKGIHSKTTKDNKLVDDYVQQLLHELISGAIDTGEKDIVHATLCDLLYDILLAVKEFGFLLYKDVEQFLVFASSRKYGFKKSLDILVGLYNHRSNESYMLITHGIIPRSVFKGRSQVSQYLTAILASLPRSDFDPRDEQFEKDDDAETTERGAIDVLLTTKTYSPMITDLAPSPGIARIAQICLEIYPQSLSISRFTCLVDILDSAIRQRYQDKKFLFQDENFSYRNRKFSFSKSKDFDDEVTTLKLELINMCINEGRINPEKMVAFLSEGETVVDVKSVLDRSIFSSPSVNNVTGFGCDMGVSLLNPQVFYCNPGAFLSLARSLAFKKLGQSYDSNRLRNGIDIAKNILLDVINPLTKKDNKDKSTEIGAMVDFLNGLYLRQEKNLIAGAHVIWKRVSLELSYTLKTKIEDEPTNSTNVKVVKGLYEDLIAKAAEDKDQSVRRTALKILDNDSKIDWDWDSDSDYTV